MADLRLKRASFLIRIKKFSGIDDKGVALYRPALSVVRGEIFTYLDVKWGIYRKEHTDDARRKNDYVMVDLATGRGIYTAGRKSFMFEDIEMASLKSDIREYLESEKRARDIRIFKELKKGKR